MAVHGSPVKIALVASAVVELYLTLAVGLLVYNFAYVPASLEVKLALLPLEVWH